MMKLRSFHQVMIALGYVPFGFHMNARRAFTRFMRTRHCEKGRHLRDGNYCAFECGTLLNAAGWRRWAVELRSGEVLTIAAIGAPHAVNLAIDQVFEDSGRRLTPTDAVRATSGQIATPEEVERSQNLARRWGERMAKQSRGRAASG
jgi:hypothetical protein